MINKTRRTRQVTGIYYLRYQKQIHTRKTLLTMKQQCDPSKELLTFSDEN